MNEVVKKELRVPCPGFYETQLSAELDHAEEMWVEGQAEETGVDQAAIADAVYWATDYSACYLTLARKWVEYLAAILKEKHEIELPLEFVTMESPREYNFTTDRVFATLPLANLEAMRAEVPAETLAKHIRERHSSRSGFISFYADRLDDPLWQKPVADWDHNQLQTLFEAWLLHRQVDWRALEDEIIANMSEHSEFDKAMDDGFDQAKYDARLAEKTGVDS